jgi:FixJ family two-component response regulator
MNALSPFLTKAEREKLMASGVMTAGSKRTEPKVAKLDEVENKREQWNASLKKAREAFEQLAYAERSYCAAVVRGQTMRGITHRMPNKDPYAV